ncbi:uncharacterized protein BDZ99DRAFT_518011 [Mytilinidion resinicola]|uniref:Uncharacterized protein n=1 Tax=Mytilinidion resinicola TaxID=574789 RepID=A0A6A6YTL6_9PEZI|nr:uncharacterized protein BDZ99DRAFT_518011 [Mytilinidion resinicola]KAF2812150.1 hypothetical protein BDZ99DRAFT_518011 [Mytilinidion resinicola]
MAGSRRGRGRRAARVVGRDQLPPCSPVHTFDTLTPDHAFLAPLESRLCRLGESLQQMRHEFLDLIKLVTAAKCSKPSRRSDLRPSSVPLGSSSHHGAPNTGGPQLSTTLHAIERAPPLEALKNAFERDVAEVLPSSDSQKISTNESRHSLKRPLETSADDGPSGMMKTFCIGPESLLEIQARKKEQYSKEKQQEVQAMRARGACNDCRQNKRRTTLLQIVLQRRNGSLRVWGTHTAIFCPRSTPEFPPLFSGPEFRRSSLPSLASEPATDRPTMTMYRKIHGEPKRLSIDHHQSFGQPPSYVGIDMDTEPVPGAGYPQVPDHNLLGSDDVLGFLGDPFTPYIPGIDWNHTFAP